MTNITKKAEQKGNYTVKQLSPTEIADMTSQNIRDAAAFLILKGKPGIQVTSVKDHSILAQALCSLPQASLSEVNTVIRYVNLMPNEQLLVSYFGIEPNKEILTALTKLAKTASTINGGIFSGYAALTAAMGQEKHFSPNLQIQTGIANVRIASRSEIVFTSRNTVQKVTLQDFADGKWTKSTEVGTFDKNVLFMDRVQNSMTNIVTENQIVRGYNVNTKKATEMLAQNAKLKVLSFVQWAKSAAVITTPLGLTQESASSYAA